MENTTFKEQVKKAEKQTICQALKRCAGNVAMAARLMAASESTIRKKIKDHNIDPDCFKPDSEPTLT